MAKKPTFSIVDDFVALMDLKPAERSVYMLLRCNTESGRNGVAKHTVQVTARWFTEMTQHWEKPMAESTARRAIVGLITRGVLVRLNSSQDGLGYLLAFVTDPRGRVKGPDNGFALAQSVAKRSPAFVYYQRRDELPGDPAITGVRLQRGNWMVRQDRLGEGAPVGPPPGNFSRLKTDAAAEPDEAAFDEPAVPREVVAEELPPAAPGVAELTKALMDRCKGRGRGRQGLLEGQARRVAEASLPALRRGWQPRDLASRLAAMISEGIHSPEPFLLKQVADLGAPPERAPEGGDVLVKGARVDLGSYDVFAEEPDDGGSGGPDPSLAPVGSGGPGTQLAEKARRYQRSI